MRYYDERHVYDLYENGQNLLEEVPRLGWGMFVRATPRGLGSLHQHEGNWEVCMVTKGLMHMRVGRSILEVKAGRVLLIGPGTMHAGGELGWVIEPCELVWMELDLAMATKLASKADKIIAKPLGALARRGPCLFQAAPETSWYFQQFVAEHREGPKLAMVSSRLLLRLLLLSILRDRLKAAREASRPPVGQNTPPIRKVLDAMEEDIFARPSAVEMARWSGLSPAQFFRRFQAETGMTPLNYFLSRKIERAKQLLADPNASVTDIAMRLGFCSGQYFATVFRRLTAISPIQYRELVIEKRPIPETRIIEGPIRAATARSNHSHGQNE